MNNIEDSDTMHNQMARRLFGLSTVELDRLVEHLGLPGYRAAQIGDALYRQRVASLEQMTTLPLKLRERMQAEGFSIGLPEIVQTATSIDGTERYLVRMADGETVETVWMPEGDGGERGDGTQAAEEEDPAHISTVDQDSNEQEPIQRATICISSQVGCAVNCQFCLTAKLGIRRNLTAGEIAGQVAAVLNRHGLSVGSARGNPMPPRINLVFMGMGEPFLNYPSFMDAVRLLVEEMRVPESRMTVSTSGILPGIVDFARETVRPKLAVSLNASNDTVRESIMPITRKWNIAALLHSIAQVPLRPHERVTFEYVLLKDVNDQAEHARELIALLAHLPAKVNLIVWNSGPAMPFEEPHPATVSTFQQLLRSNGVPAFIRRPRGRDIYAACGQLKRTVEGDHGDALVGIAAARPA